MLLAWGDLTTERRVAHIPGWRAADSVCEHLRTTLQSSETRQAHTPSAPSNSVSGSSPSSSREPGPRERQGDQPRSLLHGEIRTPFLVRTVTPSNLFHAITVATAGRRCAWRRGTCRALSASTECAGGPVLRASGVPDGQSVRAHCRLAAGPAPPGDDRNGVFPNHPSQ